MADEISSKKDLGKLFSIESIFKWKPIVLEENLHDYELEPQENDEFNFLNFIIKLAKCYYIHPQGLESSLEIICNLENSCTKINPTEGQNDSFDKIKDAVIHVILATKCSILMKIKKNEVSEVLSRIKSFDDMNDCNKAAINAIRSAVFALYSNEEMQIQKAFGYIDKALTLDPQNARWLFLKGLYVHKIRKMTNPFDAPSLQEKELFEDAFKLNQKNVAFMLYVADVYREIAAHASKRKNLCTNFLPRDISLDDNLQGNIGQKINQAKEFYHKAAEQYVDSAYVMFRCAEGLLKLPQPHSDIQLARKLLKAGLKKSPKSPEGNLVMAYCCERYDKNDKLAKNHLKISQESKLFDADLNMIRLQFKEKLPSFNNVEALLNLLQKYQEKPRHAIIYSQLVSYYLFVEYDLIKSCDYANKFYSLSTTSSCMQVHRSCFITYEPFPLIDVLTDEVKFKMWGKTTPKAVRDVCESFIHFMNFQNVKIVKGYPQNFRKQILEGKPLVLNPKCMAPFQKNTNPRGPSGPKPKSVPRNTPKRDNSQNTKEFFDQWRKNEKNNQTAQKNKTQLPSLMDSLTIDPRKVAQPVAEKKDNAKKEKLPEPPRDEKRRKDRSERETRSSSLDSSDEKLVKAFLKALKKKKHKSERRHDHKSKSSRRRKSPSTTSESEDDFSQTMLKRFLASDTKSDRRKKHYSESDDDSKYRRRRDRSRKRHDSDLESSDSSRHRGHRKHDKNRHKRDYSPRGRRGDRSDSDSEFGFKLKSKSRREDRRSSDRQSRRDYSPRDERDRRTKRYDHSPSFDRYSERSRDDVTKVRPKKDRYRRSASKDRLSTSRRKRVERSPSVDRLTARDPISVSQEDLIKIRSKKERNRRSISKDRHASSRTKRVERSSSIDRSSVRDSSTALQEEVTKHSKKERDRRSLSKDRPPSKSFTKKATKKRDHRSPSSYESESSRSS